MRSHCLPDANNCVIHKSDPSKSQCVNFRKVVEVLDIVFYVRSMMYFFQFDIKILRDQRFASARGFASRGWDRISITRQILFSF